MGVIEVCNYYFYKLKQAARHADVGTMCYCVGRSKDVFLFIALYLFSTDIIQQNDAMK